MEDLLENTSYEERAESDDSNITTEETEAVLYSWVHHSEDTYATADLSEENYTVSRRNKADRWDRLKKAVETSNSAQQAQKYNSADYMPKNKHRQHNSQKQTLNKRGKPYLNYRKNQETNSSQSYKGYQGRKKFYENLQRATYSPQFSYLDYQSSEPYNGQLQGDKTFNRGRSEGMSSQGKISADPSTIIPSYLEVGSVHSTDNAEHPESIVRREASTSSVIQDSGLIICKNSPHKMLQKLNSEQVNKNQKNIKQGKNHLKKTHPGQLFKERQTVHGRSIEIINIDFVNGEVINITSDSDGASDCDSIVEVSVPPKPAPPLIALDSSDETDAQEKNIRVEPILNIVPSISPAKEMDQLPVAVSSNSSVIYNVRTQNVDSKKKNKKRKKRHVAPECGKWTPGMRDFYNKSWGGESFNHLEIQTKMSGSPGVWRILNIDRYGPMNLDPNHFRGRCNNCNQYGHQLYNCPDPPKIPACAMCGAKGHNEIKCPNKICLKCGRPSRLYVTGCPKCWDKSHPVKCNACGDKEHFEWQCPHVWRKFHAVTSIEAARQTDLQATQYKSPQKLACCFCAGWGHTITCCPMKTHNMSREYGAQVALCERVNNNKRKRPKTTSFEGRSRNDFFKKRRSMH